METLDGLAIREKLPDTLHQNQNNCMLFLRVSAKDQEAHDLHSIAERMHLGAKRSAIKIRDAIL